MSQPAKKWPLQIDWFLRYTRLYLRRSFHAIHLLGDPPRFDDDSRTPLLVCLNHSSWWDVLLPFFIERELFRWDYYGVIDARQLQRYKLFTHMGMLGVDRSSLAGAKEFVRDCEALLKNQRRALWLTPQGAMISNHQRPIVFQPGLGHLAARLERFYLAYVTLHYEFWDERLPEAFVSISPIRQYNFSLQEFDPRTFVREAERQMQAQLDALLACVQARDSTRFRQLLFGKTGTSSLYDLYRSAAARLKGESFTPEHGQILTPQWKEAGKKESGQN